MITNSFNVEPAIVLIAHRNQIRIKSASEAAQRLRARIMHLPMAAQTDTEQLMSREVITLSRIVDEISAIESEYRAIQVPPKAGDCEMFNFWTIYMNDGRRIVVAGRNYVEAYSTRCTEEDHHNVVTIEPGVTRRHWNSKKREWKLK